MVKTQLKTKPCRMTACEEGATTKGYCRLHFISKWQDKYNKKEKSKEKMLDNYVRAITKKYPEKYLEVIREDLSSESTFKKTVEALEIDVEGKEDFFADIEEYIKKFDKE